MSVRKLINARSSVRHYDPAYKIDENILEGLIEGASKSPNGNNIQATRYLVIDDPEVKESLLPIAYNQQQVVEASAVIVVLGDYAAFEKENIINIQEQGFQKGYFNTDIREFLASAAIDYYSNKTEEELKLELIRDASLASMSLLLLANEAGLDTITMSGYDSDKLRKVLKIPDRYLDVMLIAIGKGVKQGHQTVRHAVNKIIFKNSINR